MNPLLLNLVIDRSMGCVKVGGDDGQAVRWMGGNLCQVICCALEPLNTKASSAEGSEQERLL